MKFKMSFDVEIETTASVQDVKDELKSALVLEFNMYDFKVTNLNVEQVEN